MKRKMILILTAISIIALIASCSHVSDLIAGKVFPALNDTLYNEYPLTSASAPASLDVQSVLGGRGQGLNCSIPWEMSPAFGKIGKDDAPPSLQFRQACVFHDFCYRHGEATYGYDQKDCDFFLQEQAFLICQQIYIQEKTAGITTSAIEQCQNKARKILLGVRIGGGSAFQSGPKSTYFEFDPSPKETDDFVLSRLVRNNIGDDGGQASHSLISFHFNFGRVEMILRNLSSADGKVLTYPSFIPLKIPEGMYAQPRLMKMDGCEFFLHFVRQSHQGTDVKVFIHPANPGASEFGCPSTDAKGEWPFNKDTQFKSVYLDSEMNGHIVAISFRGEQGPSIFLVDPEKKYPTQEYLMKEGIHNAYRMMAHEPVLGYFTGTNRQLLIFRRDSKNSNADYVKKITATPFDIAKGDWEHPLDIAISEEMEPIVPISLGDHLDGLLHAERGRDGNIDLAILKRQEGSDGNHAFAKSEKIAVNPSWMQMPLQVVRTAGSPPSSILLSRVCLILDPAKAENSGFGKKGGKYIDEEGCLKEAGFDRNQYVDAAEKISLQVRHIDLSRENSEGEGWRAFSPASSERHSCEVTIPDDIGLPHNLEKAIEDGYGKDHENRTRYEVIKRWRQAQVIPGFLSQSARDSKHPDAIFVFSGYPGASITVGTDGRCLRWNP